MLKIHLRCFGHADRLVQRYARQVALVDAGGGNLARLLGAARTKFNSDAGSRQRNREARPPAASSDDSNAAQRHSSAKPLPLHLNAGPDALSDRPRELVRGVFNLREGKRRAGADGHLARVDLPAAANVLGPDHCHGNDRRAALQRQAANAAARVAKRPGPHARSFNEDHHAVAAGEDPQRRLHRVVIAMAAIDRECAKAVEKPRLQAVLLKQLTLGDEVERPAAKRADYERVKERAVVAGVDCGAALRNVFAAKRAEAEVGAEERQEEEAHDAKDDAIYAVAASIFKQLLPFHTCRYQFGRIWLHRI